MKNNKYYKKLILVSSFVLLFSSCLSIRSGATKGSAKLYETFYVGEKGTQYFIKPILFLENQSNSKMLIDFTFRYKNEINDSVIVNFTIQDSQIYKEIDSISIVNTENKMTDNQVYLLFNEKKDDNFLSRFTMKIPLINLYNFFNDNEWYINIYTDKRSLVYESTNRTRKTMTQLNNEVFVLMQ